MAILSTWTFAVLGALGCQLIAGGIDGSSGLPKTAILNPTVEPTSSIPVTDCVGIGDRDNSRVYVLGAQLSNEHPCIGEIVTVSGEASRNSSSPVKVELAEQREPGPDGSKTSVSPGTMIEVGTACPNADFKFSISFKIDKEMRSKTDGTIITLSANRPYVLLITQKDGGGLIRPIQFCER